MASTFVDTAHSFAGFYSFILIIIGTPLNLLCFYIFKRLVPNRTNPTIIVFAHLALIELLIPFTWNMNYVVREFIRKYQKNNSIQNLEQYSLFICKSISFGAYFSLQCAAWLKTLATFARCVTIYHQWSLKKWLSRPNIIKRVTWSLIFLIGLINFPVWIINGQIVVNKDEYNRTIIQTKCYRSKFFQFWEITHLLMYNFIPFTLMILCNVLIIRQVRDSRRRTQKSKMSTPNCGNRRPISSEGGRLTKTLILITIFFIIFTSPAAIFYIVFGKRVKRHRNLITMSLSNLATTSHVTSFIIYWLTSTDFRQAAISLFFCRPIVPRRLTTEEKHHGKSISVHQPLSSIRQSPDENQRKLLLLQSSSITQ
jgi:hypothetical protein